MRTTLAALAALSLAATSAAASAEDLVIPRADLDLSSKHDQRLMENRIAAAARKYCGATAARTGTRIRHPDEARCVAEAKRLAGERLALLIDEESQKGG
ncbi:UrcA family protein [Tsuneonella sp. YG55]|uniref:UrcA family protein n=1 Tax=Tsuneonella litorea TaxID=2976475 RepID=A0A9X3A8J5_9SPHN|nr:UrcA family protein [Tsuneonella litorea]MCT2557895.1 UrcA family protein [Tsuneonella litorea]